MFDVVLCLSVTKWIHIAHGDFGVQELFRRSRKCLRPGGLLILEPQEWGSYQNGKRLLSPVERQKMAGIQMRPESFGDHLTEINFERITVIRPPACVVKGFRRPIYIYRKLPSTAAASGALSADSHCKAEKRPSHSSTNPPARQRARTAT